MNILLTCLIILSLGTQSSELKCNIVCFEGNYCDEKECKPCQHGWYMPKPWHHDTTCIKWTRKSGPFFKILKNGSATENIEWGCEVGYTRKNNTSVADDWDCVLQATTTPVTTTQVSVSKLLTSVSSQITTPRVGKAEENQSTIVAIVVSCIIAVLVLTTSVVIFFICKNRKVDNTNQTCHKENENLLPSSLEPLRKLFDKIFIVLSDECKLLFLHIDDPSGKFSRAQNGDCTDILMNWARLNPDIDHVRSIVDALKKENYVLFLQDNDIITLDTVIDKLSQADKLGNEIRKLKLDLSSDNIADLTLLLEINKDYENRPNNSNSSYVLGECLRKWSFKYPYVVGNQWEPLKILRDKLKEIGRQDIYDNFPKLAEDEGLKSINELHNTDNIV